MVNIEMMVVLFLIVLTLIDEGLQRKVKNLFEMVFLPLCFCFCFCAQSDHK